MREEENEIDLYIQNKGLQFKITSGGDELLLLSDCPYCGDPKHLYISRVKSQKGSKMKLPGFHHCKKCGNGGGFSKLKGAFGDIVRSKKRGKNDGSDFFKKTTAKIVYDPVPDPGLADEYHNALMSAFDGTTEDPEILEAASLLHEERQIPIHILREAKVGFVKMDMGKGPFPCIAFPCFTRDGMLFNFKFLGLRTYNKGGKKKKFMQRWTGGVSDLYGLESLQDGYDVILCEGELDRLSYMAYGFSNVLSVPNGAQSFDSAWTVHLSESETILLSFDDDEAGIDGAKQAAEKIGKMRCVDVQLPLNDCNECLKSGIAVEEIESALENAENFPGSEVQSISDLRGKLMERLHGGEKTIGISTGFKNMDGIIGGFREKELTIITGDTGTGKTTFCATLALNIAKQGVPVLYCNFEMQPVDMAAKLCCLIAQTEFLRMDERTLDAAIQELDRIPIYFLDAFGAIGLDAVAEIITHASRYLGIGAFFIDPLQYAMLIEDISKMKTETDKAMRLFKGLAKDLSTRIIMVVHPNQINPNRKNQKVELGDLPGSARVKQDADNVGRLYVGRTKDGRMNPLVEFTWLKTRSDFASLGSCYFFFNATTLTYSMTDPQNKKA